MTIDLGLGWQAYLGILVTAGVSLFSPFLLLPLLRKAGAFDTPNHRSSHSRVTLRGGGVAPLAGLTIGGALALSASNLGNDYVAASVFGISLFVGMIGLAEDIVGLRVAWRLLLQLLSGFLFGCILFAASPHHWLIIPAAGIFFTSYVNFTNFMDGINGISAMHGVIVGVLYASFGAIESTPWIVYCGLSLALAFAAFLPWNFSRNGLFLGDSGSYLLGGMIAAISLGAFASGINFIAAVSPLVIYIADTTYTLLRRLLKSEPLHVAHRTHVYQRLTDLGLSHGHTTLLVAIFTSATGLVGILHVGSNLNNLTAMALLVIVALTYLVLPKLAGLFNRRKGAVV